MSPSRRSSADASTALTDEARRAGRRALIAVYDAAYEAGSQPSIDSMRSEDNADAERLAHTLSSAANIPELVGMRKGIPATFAAILPESREQKLLVERAIDAYIKAACETLGVAVPSKGSYRSS